MNLRKALAAACVAAMCAAAVQARQAEHQIIISSPAGARADCPIAIDLLEAEPEMYVRSAAVLCEGKEIAVQLDDLDGDGRNDELAFVVDVPDVGQTVCDLTLSDEASQKEYPRRVRAYIKLYDEKAKHPQVKSVTYPGDADLLDMYNSIYGHGAVFESEKAAFRVYMDNRQSIDLYGKTAYRLEIDSTGFYTTPQQLAEGYGCDILWAGKSVGAGSFRGLRGEEPCYIDTVAWRRQTVLADGPVRAVVEVADGGWIYNGRKINMVQRYTLYANRRDVRVEIEIRGALSGTLFCTGVQKLECDSEGFASDGGLCASWGDNVPEKGMPDHHERVGLGLYAETANRAGVKEDANNYLTLLRPDADGRIRYYVAVCAEREAEGFKSSDAWFDYLRVWQSELQTPCDVVVK